MAESPMLKIPDHFPIEFGRNWEHVLQTMESIAAACATPETVNGEKKSFNQLGPKMMQPITQRLQPTRIEEPTTFKRWLTKHGHDCVDFFDHFDDDFLGHISLPNSEVIQSHAMAHNRAMDAVIFEAALGEAMTGKNGTDLVALPSSQIIPANFGGPQSGMTLAKLIATKSMFGKNRVPQQETVYLFLSQQQIDDLLNYEQLTSADYAAVRALVDGQISRFMGMEFRVTEDLPVVSGVRQCIAWVKSGMKYNSSGRSAFMDRRPDITQALQVQTLALLGASRTDEKKVVMIGCDE